MILPKSFSKFTLVSSLFRIKYFSTGFIFGTRARSRNRNFRNKNSSSQILLDKFVKHLQYHGSLVIRTPFNVNVRGSYFDEHHNVDRQKNKRFKDSEEKDKLLEQLSKTLENLTLELEKKDKESPCHVLLFGKTHHRIDSYSIVDYNTRHSSHLYITDANSLNDVESLVQHVDTIEEDQEGPEPDAHITLWEPKSTNKSESSEQKKRKMGITNSYSSSKYGGKYSEDKLKASLKVYVPSHILGLINTGIKTVFLVPTSMNRIYVQGERTSHVEVDCSLIKDLTSVGVTTELGNIRVRDVVSNDVRLASQTGDIFCEGQIKGHSVIESHNHGDVFISSLEGPSALVTVEDGDISVWGDSRVQVSQFITKNGNIEIKNLYHQCYILIKEHGSISVNVIEGFLTATVTHGSLSASLSQLTADSTLKVEHGDVTVILPKKRNFRIYASASKLTMTPQISNGGDISFIKGLQIFKCDAETDPSLTNQLHPFPILKIEAENGSIHLQKLPLYNNEDSLTEQDVDNNIR